MVYSDLVITRNQNSFLSERLFNIVLDNAHYIQGEGIEVMPVSESFIANVKSAFTGFLTYTFTPFPLALG